MTRQDSITGCLLGTAVGDAVGLAAEGLPPKRQARLFPGLNGPRLLGHGGMVSDDTEHTCLVASALIESAGDPDRFQQALARRLRGWLLLIPAGVGLATLRATLKLCVGVPPDRSGVWSAGNGPAMRCALLGVCFGDDSARLAELVRASARLTHTDPRAEAGAWVIAVGAWLASQGTPDLPTAFQAATAYTEPELAGLIAKVVASVRAGEPTAQFVRVHGMASGVSGYVYQTVPVALHAWLSFPADCRAAVLAVVHCGGDTDTTGAITGALVGAGVGPDGIPAEWVASLREWPRTADWMTRLAATLAVVLDTRQPQKPSGLPLLPLLARNIFFAAVILAHGFRRLLPPY